ncbi:MAG TPA: hypothetical protein VGU02_07620 [Gaiellaceae bacterium]|nr:hypothetical protein [Gaiellaceae bacterium]
MPAIGDHADRRAQPPRVLEPVLERHLAVAAAPEDEHGAADALEPVARVVPRERDAGGERVGVELRRAQEPVDRSVAQHVCV